MSDAWSCDRWGRTSGELAGVPDPFCSCSMCTMRADILKKAKAKKP